MLLDRTFKTEPGSNPPFTISSISGTPESLIEQGTSNQYEAAKRPAYSRTIQLLPEQIDASTEGTPLVCQGMQDKALPTFTEDSRREYIGEPEKRHELPEISRRQKEATGKNREH